MSYHQEMMRKVWKSVDGDFDAFVSDMAEILDNEWSHAERTYKDALHRAEVQFHAQQKTIERLKARVDNLELLNPWT